MMKKLNTKGFSPVEGLLIIVAVVLIGGVGFYVYKSNKESNKNQGNTGNSETIATDKTTEQPTNKEENNAEVKYLHIPEMGIKIKLTDSIKDAYYVHKKSQDGKDLAALSTHSLDKYSGCIASQSDPGVGGISTFKAGETDPVVGNYSTVFPDAPKIGENYYFSYVGHYDCTLEKDYELYSRVRKELTETYKSVEKL